LTKNEGSAIIAAQRNTRELEEVRPACREAEPDVVIYEKEHRIFGEEKEDLTGISVSVLLSVGVFPCRI